MEQFTEGENTREDIKNKLRQNFDGKIVPERPDKENQGRSQCSGLCLGVPVGSVLQLG